MSLYVLTVIDPQANAGLADWYFDDHSHFLRAERLARQNHIYVNSRKEFIVDLDEFQGWLRERAKEAV